MRGFYFVFLTHPQPMLHFDFVTQDNAIFLGEQFSGGTGGNEGVYPARHCFCNVWSSACVLLSWVRPFQPQGFLPVHFFSPSAGIVLGSVCFHFLKDGFAQRGILGYSLQMSEHLMGKSAVNCIVLLYDRFSLLALRSLHRKYRSDFAALLRCVTLLPHVQGFPCGFLPPDSPPCSSHPAASPSVWVHSVTLSEFH